MLGTALLIGAGLLIAAVCVLGLSVSLRRRLDRATSTLEGADREGVEALRQISRDIDKGKAAHGRFY